MRAFFRFCQDSGWVTANPMTMVKPPKPDTSPTLPFDKAQIDTMLQVADHFSAKGRFKDGNRRRLRAMILLLRYSGLRISDAAVLERARLSGDTLFLYTQKTGTPVWVRLPHPVVEALKASPSDNATYFFWNGRCLPTSAVKIWERTFQSVFELADIAGGTVHRFRDTFAWDPELTLGGRKLESPRHHADGRKRTAIEDKLPIQDLRIASEKPLPRHVGENEDRSSAGDLLARFEKPS